MRSEWPAPAVLEALGYCTEIELRVTPTTEFEPARSHQRLILKWSQLYGLERRTRGTYRWAVALAAVMSTGLGAVLLASQSLDLAVIVGLVLSIQATLVGAVATVSMVIVLAVLVMAGEAMETALAVILGATFGYAEVAWVNRWEVPGISESRS